MRSPYPCLWFDGFAEEAAEFYVGLFPDSRIDRVWRSPADTPSEVMLSMGKIEISALERAAKGQ